MNHFHHIVWINHTLHCAEQWLLFHEEAKKTRKKTFFQVCFWSLWSFGCTNQGCHVVNGVLWHLSHLTRQRFYHITIQSQHKAMVLRKMAENIHATFSPTVYTVPVSTTHFTHYCLGVWLQDVYSVHCNTLTYHVYVIQKRKAHTKTSYFTALCEDSIQTSLIWRDVM